MQEKRLQHSISQGGNIFRVSCVPCHGGSGKGDGQVVKRGYPAPSESLTTGTSTKMKDGQLFHIITYGKYPEGAKTPPRFPRMPSFASQLSPNQRWDVINYIRSMQEEKASEPVEPTTPEEATTSTTKEADKAASETPAKEETVKPSPTTNEPAEELNEESDPNESSEETKPDVKEETPDAAPSEEKPITEEEPTDESAESSSTEEAEPEDSTSEVTPNEESATEEDSSSQSNT